MPQVYSTPTPKEKEEFHEGMLLNGRWIVGSLMDEGGCGAIFEVKDRLAECEAVVKVEKITNKTLNQEVHAMAKIRQSRHFGMFANILASGTGADFKYLVMYRLGSTLKVLTRRIRPCSMSTQLRACYHILAGLKALHGIGFLHRDISPCNIAVSMDSRNLVVFDFGLTKPISLHARHRAPFRGKDNYASVGVMTRQEHGRRDDLESMLYVLVELVKQLPWRNERAMDEVIKKKLQPYSKLYSGSHQVLVVIAGMLSCLEFNDRPDYASMHRLIREAMVEMNAKFSDPWDWEAAAGNVQSANEKETPYPDAFFEEDDGAV